MKKLTRKNLDELAKIMPVLSETEQRMFVGGSGNGYGNGYEDDHIYTIQEFNALFLSGNWTGGDVEGLGYIKAGGAQSNNTQGMFNSHYIGPTNDDVLFNLPRPVNAADYIAMLHDLEYQKLGLDGFWGSLDPKGKMANEELIFRCYMLRELYENGDYEFEGYVITEEAYDAAGYMIRYFGLTGIVTNPRQ